VAGRRAADRRRQWAGSVCLSRLVQDAIPVNERLKRAPRLLGNSLYHATDLWLRDLLRALNKAAATRCARPTVYCILNWTMGRKKPAQALVPHLPPNRNNNRAAPIAENADSACLPLMPLLTSMHVFAPFQCPLSTVVLRRAPAWRLTAMMSPYGPSLQILQDFFECIPHVRSAIQRRKSDDGYVHTSARARSNRNPSCSCSL
jgi:hypothetical protein